MEPPGGWTRIDCERSATRCKICWLLAEAYRVPAALWERGRAQVPVHARLPDKKWQKHADVMQVARAADAYRRGGGCSTSRQRREQPFVNPGVVSRYASVPASSRGSGGEISSSASLRA